MFRRLADIFVFGFQKMGDMEMSAAQKLFEIFRIDGFLFGADLIDLKDEMVDQCSQLFEGL